MGDKDTNLPNEISSEKKDSAFTPKVRKSYIVTKQRKRWTEEEHAKFLEAILLHGRAWPMIEEHIGTKTCVQIRSHAQKFFSKVPRESMNRVEIPPPRPKRKPIHPYPRKQINPSGNQIQISQQTRDSSSPLTSLPASIVSDENESSPTSVLRSENTEPAGCTFSRSSTSGKKQDPENQIGLKSDEETTGSTSGKKKKKKRKQEADPKSAEDSEAPAKKKTVKLFGRTIFAPDSGKQDPAANADLASNSAGNPNEKSVQAVENGIEAGFHPLFCCFLPCEGVDNSAVAAGMIPVVAAGIIPAVPCNLYRNLPFTVVSEGLSGINGQSEGSGGDSQRRYRSGEEMTEKMAATGNEPARGFVPYKRKNGGGTKV